MPPLPPSLITALSAHGSPWGAALSEERLARIEQRVAAQPRDVRDALIAALADPERALWSRGMLDAIDTAVRGGARVLALADEDLADMLNERGERFLLAVIPYCVPRDPLGSTPDVEALVSRLDQNLVGHRYVLYLKRPMPTHTDIDVIARAVNLWLAAVHRGERNERHAVYEDGDVAFELTISPFRGATPPRVLTVGPITALDRLGEVDARTVELASRVEEALGDVPLVVAVTSDHTWRLPRGYVEQLLYGTADETTATSGVGSETHYAATFRPSGRSMFSDAVCRNLVGLWWLQPTHDGASVRAYDNPWSRHEIAVSVVGARFGSDGPRDAQGRVVMRWVEFDR